MFIYSFTNHHDCERTVITTNITYLDIFRVHDHELRIFKHDSSGFSMNLICLQHGTTKFVEQWRSSMPKRLVFFPEIQDVNISNYRQIR